MQVWHGGISGTGQSGIQQMDITFQGQFVRLEHEEQLVDVRRDTGLVREDVEAEFPGDNLIYVIKLMLSN